MTAPTDAPATRYRSVFRDDLFAGKVAVVTGAGSGLGRCTAHELAALGASVALVGRKPEKLAKTAEEIAAACPGAKTSQHSLDIRDEAGVQAGIAEILKVHGRIDLLVNNAGGQFPAPAAAISLKGWEAVVKTNLTGGFIVMKETFNQWMKDHGGAIVNIIADIWGGMPTMAHSGAARAGMLNLTETLASEWASSGVRLNAIAPGWIASSGLDTYDDATKANMKKLRDVVPLRRYGTESEIAAGIVFLLSPAANFITGDCMRIDGGVPNARYTWPTQPMRVQSAATEAFNGFHLASLPKVFQEN